MSGIYLLKEYSESFAYWISLGKMVSDSLTGLINSEEKGIRKGINHFTNVLSEKIILNPDYDLFSRIFPEHSPEERIKIAEGFKQTFEDILSSREVSGSQIESVKEYLRKADRYTFMQSKVIN